MSITANEDLGRRVSSNTSRRYAERNGMIPWREFMPKREESKFSVDRLSIGSVNDVAAIAARDQNAANEANNENRTFHGWGAVPAGTASENGRTVEASPVDSPPEKANPYHADVVIPTLDRNLQKGHARQLAAVSSWRGSPIPAG